MNDKPPRIGFPAWAGPGLGALLGAFIGFCTLLQNEPVSPWPPMYTIGLGVLIGTIAGGLLALRERKRRE
ncbi:MAG: hypothetical protein KDA57_00280 [Planctomycetales bacterium]|nr:hypothetical protein [Planctomycetales bacterium]